MIEIDANWSLAADKLQWILRRRRAGGWRDVSFVSSSKEILARCMREKGVPPEAAKRVLDCLPDTFRQWVSSCTGLVAGDKADWPCPDRAPTEMAAPASEAAE